MIFIKKILLLVNCFFVTSITIAQQFKPDQYRAVHWTMEDGLPFNVYNVTFKDVKGFLWVGSIHGELCRFDGAVFKKYLPDKDKRGAINSDKIIQFEEDSLHNIWIGTGKGLSCYDVKADTFTNFSPLIDSALRRSNITPFTISPFWATKDEMFCIEPGSLITAINIHTFARRVLVRVSKKDSLTIWWNTNKSFFDSTSQSVWTLSFYGQDTAMLQQIFFNGEIRYYPWPCYRNTVAHRHTAEDMVYNSRRNLIFINSGDGLLEFSLKDKQFHYITALSEFTRLKDYDRYVGIDIDNTGKIWLATRPKGILIYDPETEQVQQLFSNTDLQRETGKDNLHIYCDRDGIVWVSDWFEKGVYELIPFQQLIKRYKASPQTDSLSSAMISTIVPGPQGKLWIGTADGLNIFDPHAETFEVLRQRDLPGLKGSAIMPLYVDTVRHKAWLIAGSQETFEKYFRLTMYEMDVTTRKCKTVVFKNGSTPIAPFPITYTPMVPYKNRILFYEKDHGFFEIKEDGLTANLIVPFTSEFGGLTMADDQYMFLQRGGPLPNFTFENKNGKWTKILHPFDSLDWTYLLYNKNDQTYWMSLKNELLHYDKEFRKIRVYSEENGYNGFILNMQMDAGGNLWFVNMLKQVGRLDPVTGIITILSETDGYYKQDYSSQRIPGAKDAHGDLYFGVGWKTGKEESNWGLDRVYPGKYSWTVVTSSVYFRSLSINQKPFALSTGANNVEELFLKYDQNLISIETGIIDFYSKGKGRIRYKLEGTGKHENWQYGPAYYTVRYDGLAPGKYKLTVQATNVGNEFNSSEKILMISVSPPFWQTWWFRITAVIGAVAFIYLLVRWRVQQKFRRQLERSEKEKQMAEMRQKNAELQQQTTELEMQALRAQMNPHFIFNSLNSINRFILKKQGTEATEYLTKFSRLIRMILNSSANATVSLAEDTEALQLYLELERLRCEEKFSFKIKCDPDLDVDFIQVPPMLLQPFVENAIWHGLMNKEDEGHLWVNINQEGSTLLCAITDDGIGRKKAAELEDKSGKHKSMGMKITESRIAMMQKMNGENKSVEIRDLADAEGSAAGTEVVLKIPVIE